MNELIEFLKTRQKDEGLTDERFAAKFGMSREQWGAIKSSPTRAGDKFIGRVLLAYKGSRYYNKLVTLTASFLEAKFPV